SQIKVCFFLLLKNSRYNLKCL
ncbi:sigma-54 factor, Activator interacting domain family protein, partial [Chlamydia psittaci 06-1683]